jgi:hypothetical protein
LIRTVALEWKFGKPGSAARSTEREDVLREIAGVYSDNPSAQEDFEAEVDRSLAHLPDRVALSVLKDWRADLLDLEDPDPKTTHVTSLDVRIVRQLSAARVPIASLPRAVQDRLRDSIPR